MSKSEPDTADADEPTDEPTADERVVYIATGSSFGGGGTYHYDEDCRYLQRANNTRPMPPGVRPLRGEPCPNCCDETDD